MRFLLPIRPLLKGWLLSFGIYGLLALVLVGQLAIGVSMPLADALQMASRDWLPWAVLTPLLFRLVARVPLDRSRWRVAVPVHIAAGLCTLLLCSWWSGVLPPLKPILIQRDMSRPPQPPPQFMPPDGQRPPMPPREGRMPPRDPGFRPPGGDVFFAIGFRLPIYLAIISIAHAIYFYRRAGERERRSLGLEASLATARLEALKMQLQPHFLFNSLNAIAELVHKDPDAADEMLVALSSLLRLTLDASGEQQLPLRRELEFVDRYLAIEHVRLGDRVRVEFDIPEDTREALVPTFILQPLVENAVRHGLEPAGRSSGLVTIRARRVADALILTVADNGTGLPAGQPLKEGIGLPNTRARLRALHGDAARLDISGEDGMVITITLPFRSFLS